MRSKRKVIIAMSGGLDSSVAAALLKRAGFDVVGVFMKFWSAPEGNDLIERFNRCCSLEAEVRARKVAQILKIPFYVFNFEKEFKRRIVDYFLDGYKKGITPNPCVVCNKEIKFGLLLEKALKLEATFIATGHYAKTNLSNQLLKKTSLQPKPWLKIDRGFRVKLFQAKDKEKDQSYFLWMLDQNQLKRVLFPIGNYSRAEVEKLAKKLKLDFLLAIPKSVEICFIKTTINDFLKRHLKQKPGFIVEKISHNKKYSDILKNIGRSKKTGQFRILGKHEGLAFYTIGQRKGIMLSGGPYWVLEKDLTRNSLIVTKKAKDLCQKELILKNVNWISGQEPKLPLKIKAKIRYRHQLAAATLASKLKNLKTYKLIFEKPQRAITPGQSVVFYSSPTKILVRDRDQEVLGGGIIS